MRIAAIAPLLLCFVVAVSSQLTVTPLPDILFQNNGGVHNIVEQSVIWLYCTANSATATITWTKDGVTLVNDPAHIRIRISSSGMSTTSSLVVDNFQTSDDGSYVCQARDGMTTASSSTLNLTANTSTLTIMINFADSDGFPDNRVAVTVGNTQELSCVGSGNSSIPSVVWVRNGEQVVADGRRINITETTPGGQQRSSELKINFTSSDAGVYQCIFTEGAEVITTTPRRLDTGDAMLESISPRVIVLDPPEKLVIETRASGGYRQFDWTRNGNAFEINSGSFPITLQEFPNFFEIFVREPTTANDLGVYEVDLQLSTGPQPPEVQFAVTPFSVPTTTNLNGTVTVQEGDSVNIVCFSSGNPVPTISWYLGTSLAPFSQSDTIKNVEADIVRNTRGQNVLSFTEGNITSVLRITNAVYPAHDGEYTCVGLNANRAGNNTNNATITVQVQVPPEVEVTATLTRVVMGNSTTLTCTVTRSIPMGNYTYRWVHNNSITLSETSNMLTVSILTESNLGVYRCEVTNSAGLSGSNTTTIEPGNPPRGTAIQPSSVPPVVIGQSVDLVCTATGDPPISFTWVLMGEETTRLNSDPASGNFTLNITQVDQYGVYICITTNNLGTDAANIDIIQATIPMTTPDQTGNVIVGSALTLLVNITGFNLPLTSITWMEDGLVLMNNTDNITIIHGSFEAPPTTSTLVRDPIQSPMDNGTYEVTVVNQAGQSMTTFNVIVNAPAEILSSQEPTAISVNETDSVSFVCTARGFPAVDITWWNQNTRLMNSDARLSIQSMTVESDNGFLDTTSTLTIPSVNRSDAGNYTCVASNTVFGSPASDMQQFMLTVNFSVTLLGEPMDVDVLSPGPAVLDCTATGEPTPQFTWTKVFPNGTTVEVSDSMSNIAISTTLSGENVTSTLTIESTNAFDTANYSCTAENAFGPVTSSEAEVTVFVAPEIVTPVDREMFRVNRTDDITISCSARGIPPPSIMFLRGGEELNGTGGESGVGVDLASRVQLGNESSSVFMDDGTFMVSRMLTILDVVEDDAGNFTCEVSSMIPELALSLSDSIVFELVVQIPATIIVSPMNTTVVSPNPTVFTCVADGVSIPVITWWRREFSNSLTQLSSDGINVTISDRNLTARTKQSNLTILQPQPVDAVEYICVATNEITSDTASAVLTVYVEPTYLFPPENFIETVNETDSVTFVCVVVGIPAPSISFYQNGTLLDQSTDQRITLTDNSEPQDFQTATGTLFLVSRNLTLDNTRDNDSDTYTCAAVNAAANVTQDFDLVVQVVPQIINSPDNLTVVEPQDATFSCQATGRPRPDIVWIRLSDMEQLQNQSGVYRIEEWEIGDRERRSNLTILGTQPSDAGAYACVAVNEPGNAMQQATLTVHVVPNITFPPDGQLYTVNETDPVTFTCSATGIPPPEITWIRSGVVLDESVDSRISLSDPSDPETVSTAGGNIFSVSRNLTLDNTRDNDSDTYTCVASNAAANVTQDFDLVVQVAPRILDPPDDLTVVEPQDATFSCLATGRPRPDIVWTTLSDLAQLQNQSGEFIIEEWVIGDRERRSNLTIVGTQPSDAGAYACVAVNEPGSAMQQATLTVHVVPNITFPPDGLVYTVNETFPVTFTCSAIGIPPPNITWMRNGAVLDRNADSRISLSNPSDPETVSTAGGNISSVSRSLTISNTRDNDSDTYTCVASNENTVTPSVTQNFSLFVNVAPTILEPPENLTVVQPQSVTFLCNATARPRPEITWWRMGSQLTEQTNGTEISTSTSGEREIVSNLTIIMADSSDAGGYICMATNVAGQDTAAAELTVHVIPNIVFPMNDSFTYTVNEGDPVTFTCSATGIPPPNITWIRNGVVLDESVDSRISLSDPSDPETVSTAGGNIFSVSRSLTISNTRDNDSDTYVCVASNGNAVTPNVTQIFELFVNVAPTILEPPENLTVVQPQSAIFLCNATARPRPEITWWRMGSQLMDEPGVIEISNSTFGERMIVSNLIIVMSDPSDASGYVCMATNVAGQDTAAAELTVHVIPNITFPVDDGFTYTVNETYPVTFTCSATGIPPPEITWMRNGAPFNQSNTRVTLSDPTMPELFSTDGGDIYFVSRNLTLDNTMDADSGTYTCVASNGNAVDPTDVQDFELFVRVAPTILEPPENLTVVQPQSATFLCNATARPRPEITWWRMGSQLMEQPEVTEISTSILGEREIVSNLTIIMADPSDAGGYVCMATNPAGQDTATAELTVHVIPEIIFPNDNFTGYIVNVTDPVTFVCTATGIPPPTIQWFRDGVLLSSGVVLSEPSQTMVPAPMGTGMIYQVERTLTFVTTANDTDTYTCEASNINEVQSATAQNFILFVQVPPVVVPLVSGRQVIGNETGSVTLSFRIDNAAPPVLLQGLQWFYAANFRINDPYAGEEITNLTNRTTESILTFSDFTDLRYINLTVSNIVQQRRGIGETDEGRYFLVATNPAGVNFNYIDLLVYGRPLIFIPPMNLFVINNGSSAVFQCEASAVPEHNVFWTFTNSSGSTQSIISTTESDTDKYLVNRERGIGAGFGELTILDVQYEDRGRYTCTAMNSIGSDVSNSSLTVHVYPIINNVSSLTEVNVSRPATLVCLTTGFPLPSITWQKEGEEVMLTMDGRISTFSFDTGSMSSSFESSGFMSSGSIEGLIESMTGFNTRDLRSLGELGVVSVLSFDQLEREDTANYTCTATNSLPQTITLTALSPSIPLVVFEVPDPPLNAMVFDIGARWLALRWRPTFDGNRPITSFVIYRQNINQSSSFMSLGTLQASNLMFRDGNFMYNVTTGILPFTNYNFIVRACNVLGCGNASQPSPTVMTLPDVPTAPQNVMLSNITQTSIMVAWEAPTMPNGILGPYNVSYTGTKSYNRTFRDTGSQSVSGQMVVLTNLTSDTNYSIVVTSTNTAGFRNSSDAVVGTTQTGPPPPPPPVVVPPTSTTTEPRTFTLTIARASNVGGQVSHYQVIVVLLPTGVSLDDLGAPDVQFPNIDSLRTYSDIECGNPGESAIGYITAEFDEDFFGNENTLQFTVGDSSSPNDRPSRYTNGLLCFATSYTFFVRAYTEATPIQQQSRRSRSVLDKRQASGERQYDLFSSTPYTGVTMTVPASNAGLIAGAVIAVVAIIIIIVVVVIIIIIVMRRRRTHVYKTTTLDHTDTSFENVKLHEYRPPDEGSTHRHPIPAGALAAHVDRMHTNENCGFGEEYKVIQDTSPKNSVEACITADNKPKNRYANIQCFDHSRVQLKPFEGCEHDYINANFIDGYNRRNEYIATQGPLPDTVGDFWRLIWDHNAASIVMLTNLVEKMKVKCTQYWPNTGSQQYANITVTIMNTVNHADFVIRHFQIKSANSNETRDITQFHFISWPDFGVPRHATPLLYFLRRVRSVHTYKNERPLVIHCSAGVGRTGTLICIDVELQRARQEDVVDPFNQTLHMRQQRNHMVQTEAQYVFLHDAILEGITSGDTEVSVDHLSKRMAELEKTDASGETGYQKEFNRLRQFRVNVREFTDANDDANKFKNRLANALPYNYNRVNLMMRPGVGGSDYINASYIDGYTKKGAYIATQGPLKNTIEDFWRMVWEKEVHVIVMLAMLEEKGKEQCACYWPETTDSSEKQGSLTTELLNESKYEDYIMREIKVTDVTALTSTSRIVKQFHFMAWPENGAPTSGAGMIDLIDQVTRTQQQTGDKPIVIHCSAGIGRTGAFCALSTAIERTKTEGLVDVFHTIKHLRTQRPHMVQTVEQYIFCYRAIKEYVDSLSAYSNFQGEEML